jgi:hypothetical protein
MSASSQVEYPTLEPTESISVNEQTQYQPANQPVQPQQSHSVRYNPVNGGVFTKNSEYIEFTIRPQHNTWLDGSKTTLNLKFQAKPNIGTGTTAMSVFSTRCGIQGAISQLVCTNSGNTLEFITSYNRSYALVNNMYASPSQLKSAPSVRDITGDGAEDAQFQQSRLMGVRMTTAVADSVDLTCNTYECSVPISLSSLFGPSARKCLPLAKLTEPINLRLYLTNNPVEVYYSKSGANTETSYDVSLSDYSITNVSLECHQVRFTDSVMSVIDSASGGGNYHEWDADQLSSSLNNIVPSLQQDQILLSNTQFKDCKSIMNQTWYSTMTGSTLTYASLQPGLYKYNVSCDGQYILNRDVGNNNLKELHNSDALIVANLLSITRNATDIFEAGSQLNNGSANVGHWQPYEAGALPTASGPSSTPTCLLGSFYGVALEPTDPDFYYTGISTLTSKDMSRKLTGTNFKGKQIVVHVRRHNTISSTSAVQIYHSVLHVGCKIILENGQLRREC